MATKDDIENDLTLEIDGEDISSGKFIKAVDAFFSIINELSNENIQDNSVSHAWNVRVKAGSNLVSALPPSKIEPNIAEKVIIKMQSIINNIENGCLEDIDISEKIINQTKKLAKVASSTRFKVNLWFKKNPIYLTNRSYINANELLKNSYADYGSISGYIHVLSARGKLFHATIYEELWDKPIKCEIKNNILEQDLQNNFKKRVEIYGLIKYNHWGKPLSIEADEIIPYPEENELPSVEEVKGILKGF